MSEVKFWCSYFIGMINNSILVPQSVYSLHTVQKNKKKVWANALCSQMVRALSWPATSHASRVTGCHHVCPCVKLWEEGVHSQWIHWEEWLSASEKCLKWVTAVHWESETASAQCTLGLHISHCPAQLNCSLNMFERVSEQKFWTIPFLSFYTCYAADVWMGLCQIITREHFKKWGFIQTIREQEEDGAGIH